MMGRLSILLVEDDVREYEKFSTIISSLFPPVFNLTQAIRVPEAVQKIRSGKFHVVIFDMCLPKKTGPLGMGQLMKSVDRIPVLAMHDPQVLPQRAMIDAVDMGVQEVFDKATMTPKLLIDKITLAIKRKKREFSPSTNPNDRADSELMTELADIMSKTHEVVKKRVGSLKTTELSEEQKTLVFDIEEASDNGNRTIHKLTRKGPKAYSGRLSEPA